MTTHKLKTLPHYFDAVWSGRKTFEIRFDDRGYQTGDTVALREFDRHAECECSAGRVHADDCARYTGREITAVIGWVTGSMPGAGNQRGFNGGGYLVLALNHIRKNPDTTPLARGGIVADSVTFVMNEGDQPPASPAAIAEAVHASAQRKGRV